MRISSVRNAIRSRVIRDALHPPRKWPASRPRDIRLGLERIKLAVHAPQTWKGIHVGGTNGKGTICTLLSNMFIRMGVNHGLFTSPSIAPDSCRGIQIDGKAPKMKLYQPQFRSVHKDYEEAVSQQADDSNLGRLTPFEFDTALAFRVFNAAGVQYGIAEVGMGGETDATNVMQSKAVTVISKIGLDHQEFLGDTVEKIARVKAGIMRPNVPCVIDHTNSDEVLRVLTGHAQSIGAPYALTAELLGVLDCFDNKIFQLQDYEKQNLLCALMAFKTCFPEKEINLSKFLKTKPFPLGRKDTVSVYGFSHRKRREPVFVDGAHNLLGAQELAKYVNGKLRRANEPVTWVIGLSARSTKPAGELISTLVQPHDRVAYAMYRPQPHEPSPVPRNMVRRMVRAVTSGEIYKDRSGLKYALRWAYDVAGPDGVIVVTGSLYLLRELYLLKGVSSSEKDGRR